MPGLRAPMVGRDQELALLRTVYSRAVSERRPNLVTIYGDPGVGKSRLVREFLAWAEGQAAPPRVVFGRCLPYGEGVTYWPLAEILKSHAGVLDSDTTETVLGKIEASCDTVMETDPTIDAARACGAIAYTVGLEFPSAPLHDLEPRQVRDEMHAAWRAFFSALGADSPVIAVIEDIHWADPALLDLLEHLADRVVGPVLFVCPARPELTDRRPGWGGGHRNVSSLAIEPLSVGDADKLVRLLLTVEDAARPRPRPDPRARRGQPVLPGGDRPPPHRRRPDRSRGAIAGGPPRRSARSISPTPCRACWRRASTCWRSADKLALQRAAVVGRVFWPGPVRRLLNGDGERLDDALRRLEERDLILSRLGSTLAGEPEFIFKHVLTRDVAYESMPRRDRPAAHAEVATWLEETAGDRREEFVELLAYHFTEAVRGRAAGRPRGARRPPGEGAAPPASRLPGRAAQARGREGPVPRPPGASSWPTPPVERSEAIEALAEALHDDYRGDEAFRCFREAADLRLAGAPEDDRRIAYLCARTVEIPTRWPGIMMRVPADEEVVPYLELGMSHLPEGDGEERVRLLIARSMLPFATFGSGYTHDELEARRADGEEAAAMAHRLGLPELESAGVRRRRGLPAPPGTPGRHGRVGPATPGAATAI